MVGRVTENGFHFCGISPCIQVWGSIRIIRGLYIEVLRNHGTLRFRIFCNTFFFFVLFLLFLLPLHLPFLMQEIKKDMKKENIANKPPEKPINEVSNGSPLLLSETIIRTNKKGKVYGSLNVDYIQTFKRTKCNPSLFLELKL